MKKSTDSVAKGGSSVALARMLGMVFSFLLFMLLARQSPESAGTFKTVLTYIVIAEFLGMLGLHRWLAAEIATLTDQRWPLFLATNAFTFMVTNLLVLVYAGVATSGLYSQEVNDGLWLGLMAVVPSGVYACVQSALFGIGESHYLGKLNMMENIIRCGASVVLVLLSQSVYLILVVFVLTRWLVALHGFNYLKKQLDGRDWIINSKFFKKARQAAPKFALIIIASLLLRNIGLLAIPALNDLTEVATFAVAYQLFDLILVLPSVLALTTINVFSNKAVASNASLKKASVQLAFMTALIIFPLIAITCAFSANFLHFLYGEQYTSGSDALTFLMLAAGFNMIDMVLSQIMQARKDYHNDMVAVAAAAVSAVVLTLMLTIYYGAAGAAFALMCACLINVVVRLSILKQIFPKRLLLLSLWKPTLASLCVYWMMVVALHSDPFHTIQQSKWLWMLFIPVALIAYAILIFMMGTIKKSHRSRMHHFLFKH